MDKKGRIIKLIGGLYTVVDDTKKRYTLKPLGIFRHRNIQPKVGDLVTFNEDSIIDVEDRSNDLYRPMIANVDQVLLVNSAKKPDFSFLLLDKFLTLIEANNILPIIIITKVDLLESAELEALKAKINYYEKLYTVIYFSAKTFEGKQEVLDITKNKVNVLAGQTGAGKSSLLNAIDPNLNIETNEISEALGRGKHTTRHVELITFGEGYIADTPGFSKLEFVDYQADQIRYYFPDFFKLSSKCKFYECTHIHEPGCEIIKAYESGGILKERYEDYKFIYNEIKLQKPIYRRDVK
ncbi:MAG: ribosome small subunit-dependent GTPase A [Tenericutes bacterium HGW-Tenericutes-5]|nr:MAG: ribosome small subunit-dependent GTPase A [Tenericutes bacterium HGW-Tenericutes-5]